MEKKEKEIGNLTYIECIEAINILETKKYEIIEQMAKKLEDMKRLNKIEIKDKIIEDLKGKVNPDYIRRVLGSEYADQRFAPKKAIAVANTGEQEDDKEEETPAPTLTTAQKIERNKQALEEWKRNRNYALIGKSATKEDNKKKESSPVLEVDDDRLSQATRTIEEMRADNARLNNENMRLKEEMVENATVAVDQKLFREVIKFVTDKNVSRIYLDFDTNMVVKNVRATLN